MPSDTDDGFTPRTQNSFLEAEAAIELEEAAVLHEHKNISDDYDRFNEQSRGELRQDAAATKRIAVEQLEDEACSRDCRHPARIRSLWLTTGTCVAVGPSCRIRFGW